jgi:FtsP/CotA-like multicopper oxidase with cupredoxin domain
MAPLPLLALEITLTAAPVNWEVAPGVTVAAWAYNGTVPGPALHAQPGETVRVRLVNDLAEPTTIHWHGVPVPNGMDGVPGVTAPVVQPGQSFLYVFTAPSPGTYWYHPHFDSAAQIGRGLYGLLVVDPPAGSVSWTREIPLVIGEFGAGMPGMGRAMGGMSGTGLPRMGTAMGGLFLINGKTAPAVPDLVVNRGEKVLFRFVNTGNMVHPMHVHGLHWQVTATDGFDVPSPYAKDTLPINAGERYDAVLDADNPGTWMIHCHNLTHVGDGPVGLAFQIIVR